MFLLPSVVVGLVLALALGGDLRRIAALPLRFTWTAPLALAIQAVIFSGHLRLPEWTAATLHLASYGLLIAFVLVNARTRALLPVAAGLLLNVVAIVANGGVMPVSPRAAAAAGIATGPGGNASVHAAHLLPLGDVFALPAQLPFANVFSVGDVLIGAGMIAFLVAVAVGSPSFGGARLRRLATPLAGRTFGLLAAARFVTQAGDWLTVTAVVGWMFETTHSTTNVTAVLLARMVPAIVGGAAAAVVVDRLPKRPLLVGVELARGGLVVAAFAAAAGNHRLELLAALAVSGLVAPLSSAAVPALVPRLLDEELYEPANAALGVADNAAAAFGAAGGGAIIAVLGIRPALGVDVATFVVAALLYAAMRLPPGAVEGAARAARRLDGIRYLLRTRRVLAFVAAFGAATLATGLVNASLPRLLDLRSTVGAGGYGYGIAAITLGLAAGEMLVGTLRLGSGAGRWIGCGLVLMAALLALLSFDRDGPTIFLVLLCLGVVDGTTDIVFETVVQRETEQHVLGSVFGFAAAFVRTTMIFSFALAPLVNRLLPPDRIVLATGGFLMVAGLAALAAVVREARPCGRIAGPVAPAAPAP